MKTLHSPLAPTDASSTLPGDLYLRVRQKEGRLYSDEITSRLPRVPPGHPLENEWRMRADSVGRLLTYLRSLPRPLYILDVGCGNGWLSHHIADTSGVMVCGLDRLGPELLQASHLFTSARLAFLSADIAHLPFPSKTFDIILLVSVIQYFSDLRGLVSGLRSSLTPRGEIHIMDSPIYDPRDLDAARRRTYSYYSELGFPEMAGHYFHHTTADFREFAPLYLYRPDSLRGRAAHLFGNVASPFPWLRIR